MQLKCCSSNSFQSLWDEYEKATENTTLTRRLSAFGLIAYPIDFTMAWGWNKIRRNHLIYEFLMLTGYTNTLLRNIRAKKKLRRMSQMLAKSTTINTMTDTYHDYNITRTVWLVVAQNIRKSVCSLIGDPHIMQNIVC